MSIRKRVVIGCSLIEPDSGKLVDLLVPETQRDSIRKEARSLPQIRLSRLDLELFHVVSKGWATPHKGFMRQTEFLQTLHFNWLKLQDGFVVNMSLPIVLAIDDLQKEAIGQSKDVALLDQNGKVVTILINNLHVEYRIAVMIYASIDPKTQMFVHRFIDEKHIVFLMAPSQELHKSIY
ncbi:hypothetical protein KI387_040381, partial [Taxus chinensis]